MCTFQVRGPHFYCPEKLESRVQNLALAVSAEQVQHIHKTLYSAYAQAETRRTPPEKATPSKNELIINKNKLQKEFEQTLHKNRYHQTEKVIDFISHQQLPNNIFLIFMRYAYTASRMAKIKDEYHHVLVRMWSD